MDETTLDNRESLESAIEAYLSQSLDGTYQIFDVIDYSDVLDSLAQGSLIFDGKSIQTKNVKPYTIVGGNPAKFIRKRC